MSRMNGDPMERSRRLRREADEVMGELHLHEILAPCGRIVFTGSYFLDVMVYPDIDLYVPMVSIGQLFQAGGRLAECRRVLQVVFERSDDPRLPGGLYLKPRIAYGDWGRPWKIDIWSLDEAVIEQKMEDMYRFQARMTEELRVQIIRYKTSILTPQQRTPAYSSYHVYKAFLDEGLADFAEVSEYLRRQGFEVG